MTFKILHFFQNAIGSFWHVKGTLKPSFKSVKGFGKQKTFDFCAPVSPTRKFWQPKASKSSVDPKLSFRRTQRRGQAATREVRGQFSCSDSTQVLLGKHHRKKEPSIGVKGCLEFLRKFIHLCRYRHPSVKAIQQQLFSFMSGSSLRMTFGRPAGFVFTTKYLGSCRAML